MDNYYNDKYNLDGYASYSISERRTRSSRDSSRPKRSSYQRPPRKNKKQKNVYRSQRDKKPKIKKAVKVIIIILVVLVVAAAGCFVGYHIYRENKKNQPFKYSEGVKISGIDISGLSLSEAKAKLKKYSFKTVKDFELKVVAKDIVEKYDKKDFTYTFDYDTPLMEAKTYSLKEQGIYEPPKGSTEPTDEGELKMPKLTLGYTFRTEKASKISANIAKKVDSKPKNAKVSAFHPFSENRFEYKEGVYGYELDETDLTEKIEEFMTSGKKNVTVEAKVEEIAPSVTAGDLTYKIVGLATASTTSYNTKNGNTNMSLAMKACNGSIIEPGETWSFNACTGDSSDPANGYKKATVITDKKLEEGVGGGICQASTTIFQAAAFANMNIIQRYNHFWASGYAYSGEDATIDYPNLDLKLGNPTNYQMFIECKMEGAVLTCNIYGVQEDYYDNVKIYTKNYNKVKKKNYTTDTYRVLYLNGQVVSETLICQSYYSLSGNHIVQDADRGTFRTMVNGTTKTEYEPKKSKKINSSSG